MWLFILRRERCIFSSCPFSCPGRNTKLLMIPPGHLPVSPTRKHCQHDVFDRISLCVHVGACTYFFSASGSYLLAPGGAGGGGRNQKRTERCSVLLPPPPPPPPHFWELVVWPMSPRQVKSFLKTPKCSPAPQVGGWPAEFTGFVFGRAWTIEIINHNHCYS